MGRTVYAEEGILNNIQTLAKPDCYEVGLIIGQTNAQRDYVVHLARTPRPANKDDTQDQEVLKNKSGDHVVIKSLKDLQDYWITEHAKHVTRMLPGGFYVMGVFTVGPGDIFADATSVKQLRQVLVRVKKHLSTNQFLFGDGTSAEKLLLHFDNKTRRHTCRMFNADNTVPSSGTPVEWKFQAAPCRWHQIECQYELDQFFPVTEGKAAQPIKKSLQEILIALQDNVRASTCIIEGQAQDPADLIESVDWKGTGYKSKGKKESLTLSAVLYQPCKLGGSSSEEEMQLLPCGASMNVYGTLASRVFVNEKATVGDAVQALKEDIIRSMAARLELHWDSLIEEEQGSPEEKVTLHEPPRRVLVPLPNCRVALSDYLFPGEGPNEALVSLQELLDLDMNEDDVLKDLELQADPTDFCPPEVEGETSDVTATSPSVIRGTASSSQKYNQQTKFLLAGLVAAAAVLILSITVQLTGWFEKS